jgi:membrane protease YdiL (CAAX protease family)
MTQPSATQPFLAAAALPSSSPSTAVDPTEPTAADPTDAIAADPAANPVADSAADPAADSADGRIRAAIRRRPLIAFFTLACALSWWPGILYLLGLSPLPVAGFGPFLAAVTVLSVTEGRAGIGRLLRSMVQWRVPARVYLMAIGTPLLVSGTAVLANLALGADVDPAKIGLWTGIPVTMLAVLLIPGMGGAWEEPGFRGYALGRLEGRLGRLAAAPVLGVFWVLWHLPLFLAGQILFTDVLTVIAASIVIAAVFHAGRESVLIAMLLHATNNAVGGSFASLLFHGSDNLRLGLLTAAGWWLVAGTILVRQYLADRSRVTVSV